MRDFEPEPADYCPEVHPIYQQQCLEKVSVPHKIHRIYRRELLRYCHWSRKSEQPEQPSAG